MEEYWVAKRTEMGEIGRWGGGVEAYLAVVNAA